MRRYATLMILVAVLAACAGPPAHRAAAPNTPPGPALLLATSGGIEAVSASTGALRYRVAGGVATADGAAIMATEGDRLVVRNARTGAVRKTVAVGSGFLVSAVSPSGLLVALSKYPAPTYLPAGRTMTPLVVVHLADSTVRRYDLGGNLAPDAFSDTGTLFLVSYLPPTKPDRYQITSLILQTGEVVGVFGWQKEALDDMSGQAGTRVLAPDGKTLFTLYLRPPAVAGPATGDLRAEVHALKLDAGWAHCIDLPTGLGGHALSASALAVSPNGARLYVVDRAQRQLVEIDTEALAVTRSTALSLTSSSAPTSLAAPDDGHLYVSDGSSVVVVDTSTLKVAHRWAGEGPITALVAAGGGNGVLASRPGHIDTFTPALGRTASTVLPADATAVTRILT